MSEYGGRNFVYKYWRRKKDSHMYIGHILLLWDKNVDMKLSAQVKTSFWNSLHQVRSKPYNTDIYEVNLQFLLILCKGSWFVCIKDIKYCLMQSEMPSSYWKI